MERMTEHRWEDVSGWGGALFGTRQCGRCNRVASPTDPKREQILSSECQRAAAKKPAEQHQPETEESK